MPDFPRDILPVSVAEFNMPGPLKSGPGASGKVQTRGNVQAGRTWTETFDFINVPIDWRVRKWFAQVNDFWTNGTIFNIQHYYHLLPLGGGTGTPTINGADQTGKTIVTAGWGGTNPILKAGDLVRLPGISKVFDITADVNHSAGAATLPINPPVYVGGSPTQGGTVLYSGVILTARIDEKPEFPLSSGYRRFEGVILTFREAV